MNDAFEKLLNKTIGIKTPTLEEQLADAQRQAEVANSKVDQLKTEIETQRKKAEEAAKAEREIVIRYVPDQPLSVRFLKGEEPLEKGKPDNVVALLDAAALVMSKDSGVNQAALTAALLTTLMRTTEIDMILQGVFK